MSSSDSLEVASVRPMSHLRQESRVKVASVTGRVARCVMARRTIARLVFAVERCSILCVFDSRQSRASKTRDKIAAVTSVLCDLLQLQHARLRMQFCRTVRFRDKSCDKIACI